MRPITRRDFVGIAGAGILASAVSQELKAQENSAPPPQQDIPPSVFLGYCAKEHWPTPEGWRQGPSEAVEVCSASDCISSRPPGCFNRWDFNRAACWKDETSALSCVLPEEQSRYRLYAYRAIPLVFGKSGVPDRLSPDELFDANLPELPPEADLSAYDFLGYDPVEYTDVLNYGCSPLSCNGMEADFPVNRYCLLDSLESAYQAATAFGIEQPEPGPYILFEIWRKRTG